MPETYKKARKFILASDFHGMPKLNDFKLVEETISTDLKRGEMLAKAEWLSVDPYMRGNYVDPVKIGQQLKGSQVARVIQSHCHDFSERSQIVANLGWRDMTVFKPNPKGKKHFLTYTPMPELKGLPDSYALGCGMPGNAAYHGLIDLCQPNEGEVLVVSAAAGAVGSLVGQLGKIKGCKVLGFAGSQVKLDWMKNELGFDHVFNYKEVDLNETFEKYAPDGIDIYFDNVGGDFVGPVVRHMKKRGRICQSGCISTYNDSDAYYTDPISFPEFRAKQLQLKPLNSCEVASSWFDRIYEIRDWILEGKIKIKETVMEPFEAMPQAFIDLLQGRNVGKMIIRA